MAVTMAVTNRVTTLVIAIAAPSVENLIKKLN